MDKLSFKTGIKKFEINDDPNRVIEFNPTDPLLLVRLRDAAIEISEVFSRYSGELEALQNVPESQVHDMAASILKDLDIEVRTRVNNAFGSDVCSVVLGGESTLVTVDGTPLIANFLNAVIAELTRNINSAEAELELQTSKYTSKYEKSTSEQPKMIEKKEEIQEKAVSQQPTVAIPEGPQRTPEGLQESSVAPIGDSPVSSSKTTGSASPPVETAENSADPSNYSLKRGRPKKTTPCISYGDMEEKDAVKVKSPKYISYGDVLAAKASGVK